MVAARVARVTAPRHLCQRTARAPSAPGRLIALRAAACRLLEPSEERRHHEDQDRGEIWFQSAARSAGL